MSMRIDVQILIAALTFCSLFSWEKQAVGSPLSQLQIDQAASDGGLKVTLDISDGKPVTGLGLFIGVCKYPNLPNHDLDGCVNDAIGFHAVFTQRFGISHTAVLTNGQATKANIFKALSKLMVAVRQETNGTDKTIPVVITFSGHGTQGDTDDDSETDGQDELWIPNDAMKEDGYIDTSMLISDNFLKRAFQMIADRGGYVTLISDSCHSGSIHREADKGRSLDKNVIKIRTSKVQEEDPFKDVPKLAATRGEKGTRGFVSYSACMDKQRAYETRGQGGNPYGRLSSVLIKILSVIPQGTTYDEVAKMIAVGFAEKNFSSQTPQYHTSSGKADEIFINGGFTAPHAEFIPGSVDKQVGVLNMGQYHGVDDGAVFRLFANLDDLTANKNSIGTATATKVEAMTTTVKIESNSRINAKFTVAKLDMIRFGEFKVFVDKRVPDKLHAIVAEMEKFKQLIKVDNEAECDVAVYPMADSGHVGIYPKDALPNSTTNEGGLPLYVLRDVNETKLAYAVARTLLRHARSDRFFSLSYAHDNLSVNLIPVQKNSDGKLMPFIRKYVGGVCRLVEGDLFVIRVTNNSDKPMFVYVFGSRIDGSLVQLYPDSGDKEHMPVLPEEAKNFPPDDPFNALRDGKELVMRGKAKVIVTAEPFNFRPLLQEPDIGKYTVRSGDISNQLGQFVNELLLGGQTTRGGDAGLKDWAATTVVFDVERKKTANE